MKSYIITLALLGVLGMALAACPNHCSGRGSCVHDDVCVCFDRFTGADCSQRLCKENIAWVDGATDDAHAYAECSNRGVCDRETGECVCDEGFDGAACQRLMCPHDCSGHGTCEYITELDTYAASNWDATKVQGCNCDGGWEGYDCSLRRCPRGDDPLTSHSFHGDIWTVTVKGVSTTPVAGDVVWIVRDLYDNWETSRPFDVDDAAEARAAIEDMHMIEELNEAISIAAATPAAGSTQLTVTLGTPARVEYVGIEAKACDDAGCFGMRSTSAAAGDVSTSTVDRDDDNDVNNEDYKYLESDVCSNRGLCNSETGQCECFEGHTGLACEVQSILV